MMRNKLLVLLILVFILGLMQLPGQVSPVAAQSGNGPKLVKESKDGYYIITFEEPSLAASMGEKLSKADANDAELITQKQKIARGQDERLKAIKAALGHALGVKDIYDTALNGVSAKMSREEAQIVAGLPGIAAVYPNELRQMLTFDSNYYIGVMEFWEGRAIISATPHYGIGQTVAVIDSGLHVKNDSFIDTDAYGTYTYPPATKLGLCTDAAKAALYCNNRVIGAYSYTTDNGDTISPDDSDGHGTHVASIAAGDRRAFESPWGRWWVEGVAPLAKIVNYDVCSAQGCWSNDILAAVNQAVADQVDVINLSISGGTDPWNDPVEKAFLEATRVGIFVATASGNKPEITVMQHNSPWVTTVGATTNKHTMQVVNNQNIFTTNTPWDWLTSYSVTGPSPDVYQNLKPDLMAPGDSIAAASNDTSATSSLAFESGTSMASPHVAGAALLLNELYPDLTAMQIKSVLMLSSSATVKDVDGTDTTNQHKTGSGRLSLSTAGLTGFALDENYDRFILTKPGVLGHIDPVNLNLASISDPNPLTNAGWVRKVKGITRDPVTYTVTAPAWLAVTPTNFTVSSSLPEVTLTIKPVGASLTPGQWSFGQVNFATSTVLNGRKMADLHIPVSVKPPANTAPSVTASQVFSVPEFTQFSKQLLVSDVDPGQTFSWSIQSITQSLPGTTPSITSGGVLTWTPSEATTASPYLEIVVKVCDNAFLSKCSLSTVRINVTESNQMPTISGVPSSLTLNEGSFISFQATGSDADLPAQPLTYSIQAVAPTQAVPAGAAISSTGLFTWTPTEAQGPAEYFLKILVCDSWSPPACATANVLITVLELNQNPTLTGVPAEASPTETFPYYFNSKATDPDLPAQTLTFSLIGAPTGAAIDPATGVFTWKPTEEQGGATTAGTDYTFKVRVDDSAGGFAESQITIHVVKYNNDHVITAKPANPLTLSEGQAYSFQFTVSDPDIPVQGFIWTLPVNTCTGAAINKQTGLFT